MGLGQGDLSPAYRDMLLNLFPRGKAWFKETGSFLFRLAWGCAEELARLHLRALQMIEEADPRTTNEMLADWMRAMGLPDPCCPATQSTNQFRNEVVVRFKGGWGQAPQSFIDMAANIGYTITVVPFFPAFTCGAGPGETSWGLSSTPVVVPSYPQNCAVGGSLTNGDWQFAFEVNAPLNSPTFFEVGLNTVGDPLAIWGNTQLQCKIGQMQPAHSVVEFSYA